MREIILLVTIDTECDKGKEWKTKYPFRFNGVYEGISNRLQPLFKNFGIKPTYLLSPEVLNDRRSVEILGNMNNIELGTHLHGEYIEPGADYQAISTSTAQFSYPQEIEFQKISNLTNLFKTKLGYPPTSFRAGRFGLSRHTVRILQENGYLVDSSVTPFQKIKFETGKVINFWGAPIYPYFPSQENFLIPVKSGLLEVPVSTSIPEFQKWPLSVLRTIGKNNSIYILVNRFLKYPAQALSLRPARSNPYALFSIAERIITHWPNAKTPILNLMTHNVEFYPNASPKTNSSEEIQFFLDCLYDLFDRLDRRYKVLKLGISELPIKGY